MFRCFLGALTLVTSAAVLSGGSTKQDQQEWGNYGKPVAEHEKLKQFVGKWTLTVEGSKEKGSAEFKSLYDGRFLMEESKIPFGKFQMQWIGIYGFDTHKKKYTFTSVDNMDTNTESAESEVNAQGKSLSFRGEHFDPRSGKQARYVWKLEKSGENSLIVEMFDVGDAGKETSVLKLTGERVSP